MFDPTLPLTSANVTSAELRSQFNGLKDLIDAIQSIGSATVDAVNTVPPGDPANVSVSVIGSTLHFTFDVPAGQPGADGAEGPAGSAGGDGMPCEPGPEGPQGQAGEVTLQQLSDAIATTSANSDGVSTLDLFPSDPPTQAEMQDVVTKINELIEALRR